VLLCLVIPLLVIASLPIFPATMPILAPSILARTELVYTLQRTVLE
jgi:hypothetical protein